MTQLRFLAVSAAAAWAFASIGPAHAQLEPCDTDLSLNLLNECEVERYRAWDRLLNEGYQRVIGTLDPRGEEDLRRAQRAWITYRDLTCSMEERRYEDEAVSLLTEMLCLSRLTERRTRDFEQYVWP